MRSTVTYEKFKYSILSEANLVYRGSRIKDLPDELIREWIHNDLCEAVLKLDGIVNQLYRETATLAIQNNAGKLCTGVAHTAAAVAVTGFSGLTIDAWIGGSLIVVSSNILYTAQITDNTATVITISNGSDIPALTGATVILSANNGGTYADLSSLLMIEFAEPIWSVTDGSGAVINHAPAEIGMKYANDHYNRNTRTWRKEGQDIRFDLGYAATLSGNVIVGYYALPTVASTDSSLIDFPREHQEIPRQMTLARIFKTLELLDKEIDAKNTASEKLSKVYESMMLRPRVDGVKE